MKSQTSRYFLARLASRRFTRFLKASGAGAFSLLILLTVTPGARADVSKANNGTALNVGSSYTGAVAPTSTDKIIFDSTVSSTTSASLGGNLSILGIQFINPAAAFTINGTQGATLTLGTSGIDMTAATQNLTFNNAISLGGNQTWDVASGRTLTLTTNGASLDVGANALTVQGVGNTTISSLVYGTGSISKGSGTGTLTLNSAGSSSSATTGNLFSGGITESAGTLTISGANASGTGLITTTGGTLNISAAQYFLTGGITVNGGTTTLSATNAGGGPGFLGTGINGVGSTGSAGTITLTTGTLNLNATQAAQYNTVALNGGTFATNQTSLNVGALTGTVGISIATGGTLTLGTNNRGTDAAPLTYSGSVTVTGGTATAITKQGSGTQILNGSSNTTGAITVNGQLGVNGVGGTLELGGQYAAATSAVVNAGTLRLNFGTLNAATSNLINPAATLTLGGGTLAVVGQTGATNVTQTFASTGLTAGTASNVSVVNGGGTTALNLGAITRGAGSAANFILPSGAQSTTNGITTSTGGTSNLLRANNVAYATVGGTDFAAKDAGSNIVALTTSVNASAGSLGATTDDSNINGQDTAVGAGTINTVRFNDSAAAPSPSRAL